jgi:hypothetical protein
MSIIDHFIIYALIERVLNIKIFVNIIYTNFLIEKYF